MVLNIQASLPLVGNWELGIGVSTVYSRAGISTLKQEG